MFTFILILGLSSSGKTQYSEKYQNSYHLDQGFNIEQIEKNQDITVEGVFLRKKSRLSILNNLDSNFKKVCIWIDTPTGICIEREKQDRNRPAMLIFQQAASFQPPTYDEGWDEIWIVPNGNEEEKHLLPKLEENDEGQEVN